MEEMLDAIYGMQSRLSRSEFVKSLAGPCHKYLDPNQIKYMVAEKKKAKVISLTPADNKPEVESKITV